MAEKCITIKSFTRKDGTEVAEHERCFQTKPLSPKKTKEKQKLVNSLLSGAKLDSAPEIDPEIAPETATGDAGEQITVSEGDNATELKNPSLVAQLLGSTPEGTTTDLEVSEVNVEERLSDLTTLFVSGQLEPEVFEAQVNELLGVGLLSEDELTFQLANDNWGMLTGENPNAEKLSPEENILNNQRAENWLQDKGYEPIPIGGVYGGNTENSFFVPNLTRADGVEFAREFNQESVATNEGLFYQDGSYYPRIAGDNVGGEYDDNFSTMKTTNGDIAYQVNYDFDKRVGPSTIAEDAIGSLTEDGNGNYVFYHYSDNKLDSIDPDQFGANPITSRQERNALFGANQSFYYTVPNFAEAGVGGVEHQVLIPKDEVYDITKDPLNFYDEARDRFKEFRGENIAFGKNEQIAWVNTVAQENGFKMGIARWQDDPTRGDYLRGQSSIELTPESTNNVFDSPINNFEFGPDLSEAKDDLWRHVDANYLQGEAPELQKFVNNIDSLSDDEIKDFLNSDSQIPSELKEPFIGVISTQPNAIEIDKSTPIVAGQVVATATRKPLKSGPVVLPYDSENLDNIRDNGPARSYAVHTSRLAREDYELNPDVKSDLNSFMMNQGFEDEITELVTNKSGKKIRKPSKEFLSLPVEEQQAKLQEVRDFFKTQSKENIRAFYDAWDDLPDGEALRRNSENWYVGANKVAQKMGERYGVSVETAAAVLATQSPQKDWFQNIEQANRVLHITKLNPVIDQETADKLQVRLDEGISEGVGRNFNKVFKDIKGKKLLDIKEGLVINGKELTARQASVLRGTLLPAYDLAHNEQNYKIYDPQGDIIGDSPNRFGWSGSHAVGNGINSILDPDNISEYLGLGNKVRNFNNNIVNPNSPEGYATIDTHAAGVALMHSVSADVAGGSMGLFTNNTFGINPMYSGMKEAYQELADEIGITPRALQSVTWESIRLMMPDSKKPQLRKAINKEWAKMKKGGSNGDQIRKNILKKLKIVRPSWSPEASPSFLSRVIRGTRWAGMTLEEIKSSDGGLDFLRKKGYLS
jgi:hypothetical protein